MILYERAKSFEYNAKNGVIFTEKIPERVLPDKSLWYPLFDYKVASPLGIPACGITTGKGIELASKLGFDILTYKTIRSLRVDAHPMPNVSLVNCKQQLKKQEPEVEFYSQQVCDDMSNLAVASSFGNSCLDTEWLLKDIAFVRSCLHEGQVLLVSVYGSVEQKERALFDDFAYTAQLAQEAGAQAIEINISCPNYCGKLLYKDATDVYTLVKKVVAVVNLPVVIKVGIFDTYEQTKEVLLAAARAGARGICGINSVARKIINSNGTTTFGKRVKAGVSGKPIFNLAQEFVKDAKSIIEQERLGLTLLATGGVVCADDFDTFLQLGADIAMSAAGAMWNPYLAHQWHIKHALQQPRDSSIYDQISNK